VAGVRARRLAEDAEHATALFYCNFALQLCRDGTGKEDAGRERRFLARQLAVHANAFSASVRKRPRAFGLGQVNCLVKAHDLLLAEMPAEGAPDELAAAVENSREALLIWKNRCADPRVSLEHFPR
jgi:hypothetical protein